MHDRIPVGPGLLKGNLDKLSTVHLAGTRCRECGEVMFGTYSTCAHCASDQVDPIALSDEGTLWTYTKIYHLPPGQYRGPRNPFEPFGEGLVELPEGVRVISVLDCDIDKIQIGMKLKFAPYVLYENENEDEVVAWKFKAVEEEAQK